MALNSNALTTVEAVRIQLDIPLASVDADVTARLENLINTTSESIEQFLERRLNSDTYTETQDGRNSGRLVPRQWPITSITSIHIDFERAFGADTLVDAGDYSIVDDETTVEIFERLFPNGRNNIQIIYTAGFATIPSDLAYACDAFCEWLEHFNSRQDIGRTNKSKGDESVAMGQKIPPLIRELIMPYKRFEFPTPTPIRNI